MDLGLACPYSISRQQRSGATLIRRTPRWSLSDDLPSMDSPAETWLPSSPRTQWSTFRSTSASEQSIVHTLLLRHQGPKFVAWHVNPILADESVTKESYITGYLAISSHLYHLILVLCDKESKDKKTARYVLGRTQFAASKSPSRLPSVVTITIFLSGRFWSLCVKRALLLNCCYA